VVMTTRRDGRAFNLDRRLGRVLSGRSAFAYLVHLEIELQRGNGADHQVAEVGHLALSHGHPHVNGGPTSANGEVLRVDKEPQARAGPIDRHARGARGEFRVPHETG